MSTQEDSPEQKPKKKSVDEYNDDTSFTWKGEDEDYALVPDSSEDDEDPGFDPYNTGTLRVSRR